MNTVRYTYCGISVQHVLLCVIRIMIGAVLQYIPRTITIKYNGIHE